MGLTLDKIEPKRGEKFTTFETGRVGVCIVKIYPNNERHKDLGLLHTYLFIFDTVSGFGEMIHLHYSAIWGYKLLCIKCNAHDISSNSVVVYHGQLNMLCNAQQDISKIVYFLLCIKPVTSSPVSLSCCTGCHSDWYERLISDFREVDFLNSPPSTETSADLLFNKIISSQTTSNYLNTPTPKKDLTNLIFGNSEGWGGTLGSEGFGERVRSYTFFDNGVDVFTESAMNEHNHSEMMSSPEVFENSERFGCFDSIFFSPQDLQS